MLYVQLTSRNVFYYVWWLEGIILYKSLSLTLCFFQRLCCYFLWNKYFEKTPCFRSSRPEVFLGKGVLQSNFIEITLGHWCSSVNLLDICRIPFLKNTRNFIQIILWHGCSPANLLHICRIPFLENTSGWLLLMFYVISTRMLLIPKI